MEMAQRIVNLGRAARNTSAIKNRQPLQKLYVVTEGQSLSEEYVQIITDELNVKELSYLSDGADLLDYHFKPQLRTLGKKLGAKLNAARTVIDELPGKATKLLLDEKGEIEIEVEGEKILLLTEDLLVENVQPEGLSTQEDKGCTVSLDTTLTPELIEEGFVREIVSKVQTQRKDAGFEVTDRIRLYYDGNDIISDIMERNKDMISEDVLAFEIVKGQGKNACTWDINGESCVFSVEKKG